MRIDFNDYLIIHNIETKHYYEYGVDKRNV
jgi:predicted aldo/keto reductase-like oxidoreductase